MDITSIYGSTGTALIESAYANTSETASSEGRKGGRSSSWSADSVSISQEARERLAALNAEASASEEDSGAESRDGNSPGAASSSGGGSSSDSDSKLEALKARLSTLQASLSQAGGSEAANISAQMSQVMEEIAALEAEAAA